MALRIVPALLHPIFFSAAFTAAYLSVSLGAQGTCVDSGLRRHRFRTGARCTRDNVHCRPWGSEAWMSYSRSHEQREPVRGTLARYRERIVKVIGELRGQRVMNPLRGLGRC
jgi:hypothetical protein